MSSSEGTGKETPAVAGKELPSRRSMLRNGAFAGVAAVGGLLSGRQAEAAEEEYYRARNGRINQSVVSWCFNPMKVEALARAAVKMGIKSVELVAPKHWPMLKKLGLTCAITPTHGFRTGFAHKEEQAACIDSLRKRIDETAEAGFTSVITFSGFRKGLSDEDAINNMVSGFKKIVGHAEKKKVDICLEMLNSRVDVKMKGHPGYMCDKIEYALDVCKRVGSPRMKMLFDIYHVQIMEGDVIVRLRECKDYIGHYHTAGVPGRAELDNRQELNYPGIMKAIAETGYTGYVGQEFIPTRDPLKSLNEAVRLCDV